MQDKWSEKLPCERRPADVNQYNINTVLDKDSILFIRAMGMGDMLFMSPLLSILKQKYPSCKIGFAAVKAQHHMLEAIPNIDEIVEYPIEKEKFNEYKHHFTVSGLVEGNPENQNKNVYQIFLEHLGISPDILTPDWFRPVIKESILTPPVKVDDKLIGLHPFAVDPMRQLNLYTVSHIAEQLITMGYNVVLFSDEFEKKQYTHLFDPKIKWAIDSVNNIHSTARLLASCKVVLSSDSLITHLSQAVGTKCICVYGPFPSESRVSGYKNVTVIDNNPDCRCSRHQLGQCPKGFKISPCLSIDPKTIIDLITEGETSLEMTATDPEIHEFNWENYDVEATNEEVDEIQKAIQG
jgi:ADP-heptose:LPS heptosyltransferase